ncbi:MAG: hypothetical protein ACI308_11645 [Muribaculaceae bacterium]
MMKYFKIALLSLTCMLLAQCSEEDEKVYPQHERPQWTVASEDFASSAPAWTVAQSTPGAAPQWQPSFAGNDAAPAWTDPDKTVYPTSMTAVVRLTPILELYADDADQMAAFIGNECRGVATTVVNNGVKLFFIQIKGSSSENGNVELRYYSNANSRTYNSVAADLPYEINKIYGTVDAPAYPDFELSGPYPLTAKAYVSIDASQLPFAVNANDEVAAFVGSECRSIAHVTDANAIACNFDILGAKAGEEVWFKYFSAQEGKAYISEQKVVINSRGEEFGSEEAPMQITLVPEGSMTAYLTLDKQLQEYVDVQQDELAAFASGQCIGKGEVIGTANGMPVYKMVINGLIANGTKVDVQYYNSKLGYVFTAASCIDFAAGTIKGTEQAPATAPLSLNDKHPLTMEAYLVLTSDLARYASSSDLMAAFVGDQCRSLATVELLDDGTYGFKLTINGGLSDNESITIQYYSQKNSYLYRCSSAFTFKSGTTYGMKSDPRTVVLKVVE